MKTNTSLLLFLILLIPLTGWTNGFAPISGIKTTQDDLWSAWGGQINIEFNANILNAMGIEVIGNFQQQDHYDVITLDISQQSSLQFWAPNGAFDGFYAGSLKVSGGFHLKNKNTHIDMTNISVVSSRDNLSLAIKNSKDEIIFFLDHIHEMPDAKNGKVFLGNMSLRLSKLAADRIGWPQAANMSVGGVNINSYLHIPGDKQITAGCDTPRWDDGGALLTDVALINIGSVDPMNKIVGQVAIAPSATLENVGTADVPWYDKFTTTSAMQSYPEPYDRDQHPFLVWNVYRLFDGRFEQLGASGVKHAFFTTNQVCTCIGGHVLWAADNPGNGTPINGTEPVGCQDTYSSNNNNQNYALGFREEVNPNTASWEQCGSMFALNGVAPGPCPEERSSIPFSEVERRLYVNDVDLQTPGGEYFVTAWYVVKDDINIFNTMGYRKVVPSLDGSLWTFDISGNAFSQGSATDQWVDPNNIGATQSSDMYSDNDGHIQLMSQVEDLGAGLYRYTYGLMNYDYSAGISTLSIPYFGGLQNSDFDDADHDVGNDWQPHVMDGSLDWESTNPTDKQPWYTLNSIVMEVEIAPVASQIITITDPSGNIIELTAWAPGRPDSLFNDGFEE